MEGILLDVKDGTAILGGMQAEERRRFLEMSLRRAGPGTGSARPMVREERADYGWAVDLPDFGPLRYMIVGGLATALYMPERMTLDTDVLVLSEDLAEAEDLLKKAGCEYVGSLSIGGSTWRLPKGRSLDLIALDHAWVGEALDAAVHDAEGHPYASLAFLVLMKLESGRLQDLADISRMLGCASEDRIDAVRAVVERFRPQDMPDLQSMLSLGKLEHDE